ncbi:PE-PGRS family protein [Mycobacterium ulcerans str. Harvey]|uniref:PE-PGRS family protein n=1 Tax=Mycobacterium ulcerans str. Harvey TaxID=1299332 RepID=A0ABP3ACX1_MYCUL|nr:PE-PGRS family protein [Mycobacterium ulcerans str. Harvey]
MAASSGAIDDVMTLLATIGVAEWGVSRERIDAIGPGPACPPIPPLPP